ncbi:mitochondrial 37S ribosomal protein uS7m NDAI_0D00400 [Naumovozyma dairenensis CBS 421]|uniref:Small ribosomal subunit protein uS7m n=1 Tax=Naumovozyma dairenensis (strain ATCC 10597 / BCRC 20456 / CBS 421 / NBRC 0211 / NRRL Y-12639) TaxID=1071378 RepID=G0W993_NAUDC|nr:hypothetical protein NDAI_0D00400 [Naumovozyma dairenensis CBS 421]CCD24354.1 hypothetical protein NDAI_0D00400 [Naumovozyma dairenensis CBS 421]
MLLPMLRNRGIAVSSSLIAITRPMSSYSTCPSIMNVKQIPLQHSKRFQSTTTTTTNENISPGNLNESLQSLTDEEVDQWLESINELKKQFQQTGFNPETSLAPPGQPKIDLIQESLQDQQFQPTKEQLEEYESLSGKPIPLKFDPIVKHVTNMIMRDGKRAKAERIISKALYLVHRQLKVDPIQVLKENLENLSPLMITKTFKTKVAKAAMIPVTLNERQRHRIAWKWIVEGANSRVSKDFSVRLGEELVAVYKGQSSAFDKRDQIHKTSIAHRAYIKLK